MTEIYQCKYCGYNKTEYNGCLCNKNYTVIRADVEQKYRQRISELERNIGVFEKTRLNQNNRMHQLEVENDDLEQQQCHGMECTLDQMLSDEQRERYGLDSHEHRMNIQLMFCRACDAIIELEKERDKAHADFEQQLRENNELEGKLAVERQKVEAYEDLYNSKMKELSLMTRAYHLMAKHTFDDDWIKQSKSDFLEQAQKALGEE